MVLNCRQTPPATILPPEPNFIGLDTKNREATWVHWVSSDKRELIKVTCHDVE